ncbi:magnesium and cobalt transport protein CorA [Herminiimonas fonticola]|uniref:Magnesium transporter n=1 Tax=Herminiimonas fonticola TaxID=303380 RepID=A0A4R6GFE3_9BURK|nr:magnesium and cobalt transport protein CorA [Herminiimonas fonticola]RBA24492.1 Mg2+ and Co2+ transporter [Herminiimonas fonticola]TDN93609.1 magnesium transporter [Herminiimonas fonticola]
MLINCVAYQDGNKLSDIQIGEISDYLKRPGCFVWVALKDADPLELEQMQEEFNLHELAVEDARNGHQRPKVEEYGDSLFAVVKTAEMVGGTVHIGELDIFVGPNYILSVRNRSAQGFLGVRARCEQEPEQLRKGSAFVLYALMDAVVDRYFPVVEALETELELIEAKIFDKGAQRANIERLYELKREVVMLKHVVAPLMEAVAKLYGGRVPNLCESTRDYFRDIGDHLYRINAMADAFRETIATAIQVNLSMVTIEESEVNKRLAAWAAIFAVATAFFGLWGMNFKFMPELEWKYGYPVSVLMVGSVCGYLYYRFKKSGWL